MLGIDSVCLKEVLTFEVEGLILISQGTFPVKEKSSTIVKRHCEVCFLGESVYDRKKQGKVLEQSSVFKGGIWPDLKDFDTVL